MVRLVFVHGRAQEHKVAEELKGEWIAAWKAGLAEAGQQPPDVEIKFPYYGDTLFDLASGSTSVADVIVKGPDDTPIDPERDEFIIKVLRETLVQVAGPAVVDASDTAVNAKGPLNWNWVQSILEKVDQHIPGVSAASIAVATNDVYQYLENPGVRDTIDSGVRAALTNQRPMVVVAHSLGTVVAYNLLRREGQAQGWNVPLFMTLGSPLGVTAIKRKLSPIKHPTCVGRWVNAFDKRDVVSLHPLDAAHFTIDPPIENIDNIRNKTANRHGIAGYLDNAELANEIRQSLLNT